MTTYAAASKLLGYALLAPPIGGAGVSKALGLAALSPPVGSANASKLVGYALTYTGSAAASKLLGYTLAAPVAGALASKLVGYAFLVGRSLMAGLLLPAPVLRATDSNGAPISGALLQFYITQTTTPTNVYTSGSLVTPLSNPVVADSGGLFPGIYLDPTVTYRAQLKNAAGTVIADLDPVTFTALEATQAQVNGGTATDVYVSPATLAGWTGIAAALGYTPVNKAGDTATNLLIANSALSSTSAGYLGAPINEQDGDYTFVLGDAGKMVRGNSASPIAWTIPPNSSVAYPANGGTCIVVRNVGAGTITLTRGAGVTQYLAGGSTSKDIALVQWGLATLVMEAANSWVVSGTGIS